MGSVFFIALRRLRAPLILIIVIFAVSTAGLTLIPGTDPTGQSWHPTVFQAFYVVTYTATTIGFGEIPFAFNDTQRLWLTIVIYMSVVGWAYMLGSLLAIAQDRAVQDSIVSARFRRAVSRLREPFYVVCGLGETGMSVVGALDRLGFRVVVLDTDAARVQELELLELTSDPLALAADASSPETLVMAGLVKSECRGVLALTSSDDINHAIANAVHLLHPGLHAIARSQSLETDEALSALGGIEVIDPFKEFGDDLLLAMRAPDSHRLLTWLTGPPGTYLKPRIPAPPGAWIVCGYGRFGVQVVSAIRSGGFAVNVIDEIEPAGLGAVPEGLGTFVKGAGTDAAVLGRAGIATAAGIVAGTDDDTANIAFTLAARRLSPRVFVIARQNLVANRRLYAALGANMTMVPSEIIANECIAMLRTPLLADFLKIVRSRDDAWAEDLVRQLVALVGETTPEFWGFTVSADETPGLAQVIDRSTRPVTIADLKRSAADRTARTECLPLLLIRDASFDDLPEDDLPVLSGDRLLFAGTRRAREEQRDIRLNSNVAAYVLLGEASLGGSIWRWLARRNAVPSTGV
ncbi:MAG: NAD-binding protein [Hyphomicrobiaceae bacterium]